MSEIEDNSTTIELAAHIVAAYSGTTRFPRPNFPISSSTVVGALNRVQGGPVESEPEPVKPAVPVKKSVTPDYIICLEDGKKFKSLKAAICAPTTTCRRKSTARSGTFRRTIRWWPRTTARRAPSSPRRWASASSAAAAADRSDTTIVSSGARSMTAPFLFSGLRGPARRRRSARKAWARPMWRSRSYDQCPALPRDRSWRRARASRPQIRRATPASSGARSSGDTAAASAA